MESLLRATGCFQEMSGSGLRHLVIMISFNVTAWVLCWCFIAADAAAIRCVQLCTELWCRRQRARRQW